MSITMNEKCFNEYVLYIHKLTGISIGSSRISLIEGRLNKRLVKLNISSFEEYLSIVKLDKNEQIQFINLITTNETYFFRTPRIWDYMEKKILPSWFEKNEKKTFYVWSAAASSGEEAHSVAIVCHMFKLKNPSFNYQILGTDISNEMISLCEKGEYIGKSIELFKNSRIDLFKKSMIEIQDSKFKVLPEIKKNIQFKQHNLFNDLVTKNKFDLILNRNVLIYFTIPDQEKVLSLMVPKLNNSGVLIIGESESLSHINTSFKLIEPLVYDLKPVSTVSGMVA